MNEKDLVKSILDFSFIIKGQLHSERTALMRSILNILIMEAEDFLENADSDDQVTPGEPGGSAVNRLT